jgi:predicted RNase H-like HicB family nuclease
VDQLRVELLDAYFSQGFIAEAPDLPGCNAWGAT